MSPLVSSPSIGYPDYQRLVNYDSGELQSLHKPPAVGNITYGPINVSRWAYMAMRVQVNTGPVNVDIQWSSDNSGVNLTGERSFQLSQLINNYANLRLPNLGQYAFVTIASLVGGSWGMDGVLYATNRVSVLELVPVSPLVLNVINNAIGASTSIIEYPTDYFSGPAQVTAFMDTGNWQWIGYWLDTSGNWDQFYVTPGLASTQYDERIIVFPTGAWRILMVNSAASAGHFWLQVTPSTTGAT